MERMKIKACCVSSDYENSKKTLSLAKENNLIFPFVGIHPQASPDQIENLTKMIGEQKDEITGIGEIGLDPTYVDDGNMTEQLHTFETLLSIAEKHDKPVSIHSRKSLDQVLETLSSFNLTKVLLHWFDGNKKQLRKTLEKGYFVSYGPVMVYANDKQSLLARTDLDKILVETDGPVRFSGCFGFKTAQVSFIPSVVFCASKILRIDYDKLATVLEDNTKRFLGIYV